MIAWWRRCGGDERSEEMEMDSCLSDSGLDPIMVKDKIICTGHPLGDLQLLCSRLPNT